ncbi:MAG: rhomboid family intramembrane serine protease [Dechloromonas sp.]|nr:rhomboid family intramembrane serine protease [Dechloromonas sp.]
MARPSSADQDVPSEHFYPGAHCGLRSSRRMLRLAGVLIAGVCLLLLLRAPLEGAVGLVLCALALAWAEWKFRHRLDPARPAVSLDRQGIASDSFAGGQKRLLWEEVAGIDFGLGAGGAGLSFALEGGGKAVALPLSALDGADQERLLAAAIARLNACRAACGKSLLRDPLVEEREFHDRLYALAPVTWVVWTLVLANGAVWLWGLGHGGTLLHNSAELLLAWGGNAASEVQRGEVWRLLSAAFLHGGLLHLAMNMVGLASAGAVVERIYGHRLFLLIYLGSALMGSAFSLHFGAQKVVAVGASGAVFGITGALLVALLQHRSSLPKAFGKQQIGSLLFFISYALVFGFTQEGIDNAAHVGGLMGGCLLALVLPERFDPVHFGATWRFRALVAGLATGATVAAVVALAPPAQVDVAAVYDGNARFTRAMAEFDAAIKALQHEFKEKEAGRKSERQLDDWGRQTLLPRLLWVQKELGATTLSPTDPRRPFLAETRHMVDLLVEATRMQTHYPQDGGEGVAADPERARALELEIKASGERIARLVKGTGRGEGSGR